MEDEPLLSDQQQGNKSNRRNQIAAVAGVTIALLSTGCAAGFAGVALPSFIEQNSEIKASRDELSWIASVMTIGCILGNLVGGIISDYFGRKKSIIFTSLVSLAGWICIGAASKLPAILVGRALTGLATGLYSAPVQVYICEIVDPSIRGVAGALPSLTVAIGILSTFCLRSVVTWRTLALTCSISPLIVMLYVFFLPESPVWLLSKGRENEAAKSVHWLSGAKTSVKLQQVKENVGELTPKQTSDSKKIWRQFLKLSTLSPLTVGCLIFFFQQFCGVFPILSYATLIFQYSGEPFVNEYIETICVGVVRLISTILALFLIKYLKRRTLLVISGSLMFLANGVLGGYFYLWQQQMNDSDDDDSIGGNFTINFAQPQKPIPFPGNDTQEALGFDWIPLACLLIFMASFSIGYGIVPWFLMPELMTSSPEIRSLACSVAFTFGQICRVATVKTFLNMTDLVGAHGTFWIYAAISLLSVIFVVGCVPETAAVIAAAAAAPIENKNGDGKNRNQIEEESV